MIALPQPKIYLSLTLQTLSTASKKKLQVVRGAGLLDSLVLLHTAKQIYLPTILRAKQTFTNFVLILTETTVIGIFRL